MSQSLEMAKNTHSSIDALFDNTDLIFLYGHYLRFSHCSSFFMPMIKNHVLCLFQAVYKLFDRLCTFPLPATALEVSNYEFHFFSGDHS